MGGMLLFGVALGFYIGICFVLVMGGKIVTKRQKWTTRYC